MLPRIEPRRFSGSSRGLDVVPVTPIIDEALFDAAHEKLEQNRRRYRQRKKGPSFLLQGLVVCGVCKYAYHHSVKTWNGRVYRYYQCNSKRQVIEHRPQCCNLSVRAEALEESVWLEVCRLLKEPQHLQQEYQRRLHSSSIKQEQRPKKLVESQIKKLHKGIERIIDAYAEDLIEKSEFEPRLRGMRERLKVLEAQLKTLQDEEALANELKLVISRVEEFAAKVAEGLETLSWMDKREVIRILVKRMEVYPETVKVIFRIGTAPLVSRNKTKGQFSPHTCAGVGLVHSPGIVGGM